MSKLIIKNGSKRSGVGEYVKKRIMECYEKELEIDVEQLAEDANKKLGSKTNARCVRWYISDMRKNGDFDIKK